MMMVMLFPFQLSLLLLLFFGGGTTKYSYIILVYFWSLSAVLPFVEKDPVNQQASPKSARFLRFSAKSFMGSATYK